MRPVAQARWDRPARRDGIAAAPLWAIEALSVEIKRYPGHHADMEEVKPAPLKPNISFDVLDKIDIRVGTIEEVQDVERSDKLIRMRVNFGDHTRTIFSGMKKERKDCRDLVGKQTLFVVNLEPKKMMGELSEGMIFDIGYADKIVPALAVPERPVPNGTRLG